MADSADHIDLGIAGRSASRQAARIRERRSEIASQRSPVAAFLLGPSPQEKRLQADEKHWATGAGGEEILAATLAKRCPDVTVLHDRRIPGSRANIDHIAITATGVCVIDAKRYRGKIEIRSPLFGNPKLLIAGRDRTKLIEGVRRQVEIVTDVLADARTDIPVFGCLCFLAPEGILADSGLPVLRTLKIGGVPLYYPRRLAKQLNAAGPIDSGRRDDLTRRLAQALPAA